MKATSRAHWHASYSLNQQSGCFSVNTLTFYLDSPFNTMYKHSHQSIQDLLSLHSVFHSFTATDGQLSQLWYFFKARVIVWTRNSRQTDTQTVIVATIVKHSLMYFTDTNMAEKTHHKMWISKKHLLIKQSKAEVIATQCLQHQSFNVLKRYIIQNNVYAINKMSDVNNLSHNKEHLNVSKVYQNVSIFKIK